MKVLAAFDESPFSEATIPVLATLIGLGVEVHLCSVAEVTVSLAEDAVGRRCQELDTYLHAVASRLPKVAAYDVTADVAMYPMDAATVLLELAQSEHCDVIAMATHGRSGVLRTLLGSVAEKVVRAGVAPVLLVHPRLAH